MIRRKKLNPERSYLFEDLGNALSRLGAVLDASLDENDYVLDATIQRFEFTIELFWKTLQYLLIKEGLVKTKTPRETLSAAYAAHWIDDENIWLDMIDARNLTSHAYHQETALEIYHDVKKFYPRLKNTYEILKQKHETIKS